MNPTIRRLHFRPMSGIWLMTLLLIFLPFSPNSVLALTEQEIQERVLEISNDLRCPTCQGLSVKDSTAKFSLQIKAKVRKMVIEGQSAEDIKDYFVSRYGAWILMAPKMEGIGLFFWLLPVAGFLLAGGLIGLRLYRNHHRVSQSPGEDSPPPLTKQEQEAIAKDLHQFEEDD